VKMLLDEGGKTSPEVIDQDADFPNPPRAYRRKFFPVYNIPTEIATNREEGSTVPPERQECLRLALSRKLRI
jgi:hypothetical protein